MVHFMGLNWLTSRARYQPIEAARPEAEDCEGASPAPTLMRKVWSPRRADALK